MIAFQKDQSSGVLAAEPEGKLEAGKDTKTSIEHMLLCLLRELRALRGVSYTAGKAKKRF